MPARNTYSALTPEVEFTRFTPNPDRIEEDAPWDNEHRQESKNGRFSSFGKIRCLRGVQGFMQNNAGLLLVTASQAFFSLMNLTVKKLNDRDPPVPTLELIFVRMAITNICSLGYMLYAGIPDPMLGPKGVRLWLWFRGFSGFFGLFGIYYALQYLSLSDATVLTFLAPLCTGIAGAVFLKETFSRKQLVASICSLFGVILIARPTFLFGSHAENSSTEKGTPHQRLVAVGVSMTGVLGATGAYIAIRAAGSKSHPLHSLTSFSSQCVVVALVGMTVQKTTIVIPKEPIWFINLILIGVFGFIAQLLLTMGLQRETAGRGTLAIYTLVIYSVILEVIFYHALPSFLSICGTAIILSAAIYVVVSIVVAAVLHTCPYLPVELPQLTKEATKQDPDHVKLEDIHESEVEEGLLQHSTDSVQETDSPIAIAREAPISDGHRENLKSDIRMNEKASEQTNLEQGL